MYKKILIALDHSPADQSLLPHVIALAKYHHSQLVLLHVADGWVARNYEEFVLKDSEEMIQDRHYLEQTADQIKIEGLEVITRLALGEPSQEILKIAEEEQCDLIAMTSHGHRFLADLFYGSTIEEVRHQSRIPILIVRWLP